jgi:putative phosphoribosyl transferase
MKSGEIKIPADNGVNLMGNLSVPESAHCLVIFSHGSGSSRFSVRNNYVAELLNKKGMATLLTDLLTEQEDKIFDNRFDIELLTSRLITVTAYLSQLPEFKKLPVGYFGASTGAASALKAAAELGHSVQAVVSRGGRPDLAQSSLLEVKAPVLLIIGSLDTDVIMLNEQAFAMLFCEKNLEIVSGAGHLFQEPGTLDEVARLAADWFEKHLQSAVSADILNHRKT